MLEMLRQMTRAELSEVFAVLEEPLGPPEEAVRALTGAPWLFRWGAGDPERHLLTRAAQALGLGRELQQRHWATPILERRVYAALCAQAIDSAEGETRRALLTLLTDDVLHGDQPGLPAEARHAAALRARLGTAEGLAAFAALPESLSLAPQFDATRPTPLAMLAGMVATGPLPPGWPTRLVDWSRLRHGLDLRSLFRILTLCWRTRRRLLVDQRAEAARIDDEIQKLVRRMQQCGETFLRECRTIAWYRKPITGLSIAAGAASAALLQGMALGEPHPLPFAFFFLGGLFSIAALRNLDVTRHPEHRALLVQLTALRRQRAAVQRRIAVLEL